jgi:hypothetical protein
MPKPIPRSSLNPDRILGIELLTTSHSGKIWQKLALLDAEESRRGV